MLVCRACPNFTGNERVIPATELFGIGLCLIAEVLAVNKLIVIHAMTVVFFPAGYKGNYNRNNRYT